MPSSRSADGTRRRLLRSLAGVGAVAAVGATAGCVERSQPAVARADLAWPGFRGGPRRTGWHEVASGPDAPLSDAWTWTHEDLVAAGMRPAVADGVAYVPFVTREASGARLVVAARSLADGTERWRTSVPVPSLAPFPMASTAVTDDVVFAATSSRLVVLERDSGDERWRAEVVSDSPPVVDDGVLVQSDGPSGETTLRLLDLETGEALWTTPLSGDEIGITGGTASADGQSAFLRNGATVAAVSLSSGSHQWTREFYDDYGQQATGVAPVRNGRVELVRAGLGREDVPDRAGRLVTIDARSGQVVRETILADPTRPVASTPAVGPETVVVAGQRSEATASADAETPDGVVVAVDRATGSIRWRTHLDAVVAGRLRTGPLVDGDRAYLVAGDTTTALSVDDGTVEWQATGRSQDLFGLGDGAFVWASEGDAAPGIRRVR